MTDLWGNRTAPDPLDVQAEEAKPGIGPNGCRKGGLCDGSGFVLTKPAYRERLAKEMAASRNITDPETIAGLVAAMHARYEFVYPCRACNSRLFLRWVGGHTEVDHDVKHCSDEGCQQLASRRKH